MTVNLARLIFFDYFQNGHITGAWPLDPSADQGSVIATAAVTLSALDFVYCFFE